MQKNSEHQSKKQSRLNELSENCGTGVVFKGGRAAKGKEVQELGGDQNPSFKASLRSKIGQERKEKRRCRERKDCKKNDGKR